MDKVKKYNLMSIRLMKKNWYIKVSIHINKIIMILL